MQVGVVAVARLGKAQVVGGHHGIALRGVHGRQQEGFAVLRVGQGAGLLHIGALGIGHQRGCRGAAAGRHQHHARGVGAFAALDPCGRIVQRHHLHIALGLAADRLQAAVGRGRVDLRHGERGERGRGVDQCAARRVVRATAGDKQDRRSGHTGKAEIGHGWIPRSVKNDASCAHLRCSIHRGLRGRPCLARHPGDSAPG